MKIVHICWEYIDNMGYQEQLLPKAHARSGHEVTVITPKKIFSRTPHKNKIDQTKRNYILDEVKISRMDYFSLFRNRFTIIKGLYKKLENEKPDVIFVHMIQSLSLFSAVKYKKKHQNVRVLTDSHADSYNSAHNIISRLILHKIIWRFVAIRNIGWIDKIFFIAPMSKTFLTKMYKIPESKLFPLYLGADVSEINFDARNLIRNRIRYNLNLMDNDFTIISGGKINREKNIDLLLKALIEINLPNIHLILFGSIEKDYAEELNSYSAICSNVHYIDWVGYNELFEYFFASDLAVFPGTQSVIWQQAICSGLPLIVKKWPGGEYLDIGGNIFYLDEDTVEELVKKILFLYHNPDELMRMRHSALNDALSIFSYDEIAKKSLL